MQGIRIIRRDRQDGRVKTFRVGDVPLPLQRQRLREYALYVRQLVARCGRRRHAGGTFPPQLDYRF